MVWEICFIETRKRIKTVSQQQQQKKVWKAYFNGQHKMHKLLDHLLLGALKEKKNIDLKRRRCKKRPDVKLK